MNIKEGYVILLCNIVFALEQRIPENNMVLLEHLTVEKNSENMNKDVTQDSIDRTYYDYSESSNNNSVGKEIHLGGARSSNVEHFKPILHELFRDHSFL